RPSRGDTEELALRARPAGQPPGHHAFYWTRAMYSGNRGRRGGWGAPSWATDYPKGDRQFMVVLKRLVHLDAYAWENAVSLADPELRRFPLIYAVEVGYMELAPEEVRGLRDFLNAGGMLVVDDFWGTRQWAQFERNMRLVLPGRPIVDLPLNHPLFSSFYDITEVMQVPNVGSARRITYFGEGDTSEQDGYVPYVRAILDDRGEIMVLINWNTDLGDAWEWAEDPMYPLKFSTYAYEMGANMIVYGMSH
ncbi:MAG: DUF4159 domain-containing protein, partial [Longimicrobiales bacterium]|nr:DUF4159 domain-containing protein [Longimicrobiales bacterium]